MPALAKLTSETSLLLETKNSLMLNVLSFAASATLSKVKASSRLTLFNCGFYFATFMCF